MTTLSEAQLKDILRGNPDIRVAETIVRPRRAIPVAFEADTLTRRFETLWAALGGPALTKEYRFDKSRRWRFDFANVGLRIAIEIHGGIFSQGRHVRGQGFSNDREKMNAAQLAGWRVVELDSTKINAAYLEPWIQEMNKCR